MVEKTATAKWSGSLQDGKGTFSTGSGVITDSKVSWASRTNESRNETSPEELIASAHAACYAMAFSHYLTTNHSAPDSLEVTSSVWIVPKNDGGMKVNPTHKKDTRSLPGMDAATFADAAKKAEAGCPVSNALRGNIEITVEGTLANK